MSAQGSPWQSGQAGGSGLHGHLPSHSGVAPAHCAKQRFENVFPFAQTGAWTAGQMQPRTRTCRSRKVKIEGPTWREWLMRPARALSLAGDRSLGALCFACVAVCHTVFVANRSVFLCANTRFWDACEKRLDPKALKESLQNPFLITNPRSHSIHLVMLFCLG